MSVGVAGGGHAVAVAQPDALHSTLVASARGLDVLRSITQPVAVLSVMGYYHSGKSFLMNQLMGDTKGFEVGTSVDPKTKGLWVWSDPIDIGGVRVLLVDSEGLFSRDVSERYDAKLFAATALLSDYLLFTTVRNLESKDIDYLELLAGISELVDLDLRSTSPNQIDSGGGKDGRRSGKAFHFPPMHWILQDFIYDLDKETHSNPGQWFHDVVKSTSTGEPRKLWTMMKGSGVRFSALAIPSTEPRHLNDLSQLSDADLSSTYHKHFQQLKADIGQQLKTLASNGKLRTGAEVAFDLELLLQAVNSKSLPELPSLWHTLLAKLKDETRSAVRARYQATLTQALVKTPRPKSREELEVDNRAALEEARITYSRYLNGITPSNDFESIRADLKEHFVSRYVIDNARLISDYVADQRRTLHSAFVSQLEQLALPMSPQTLDSKVDALNARALTDFSERTTPYAASDSALLLDERATLEKVNRGEAATVVGTNNRKIDELLKSYKDAAYEQYTSSLKKVEGEETERVAVVLKAKRALLSSKSTPLPALSSRTADQLTSYIAQLRSAAMLTFEQRAATYLLAQSYSAHRSALAGALDAYAVSAEREHRRHLDDALEAMQTLVHDQASTTMRALTHQGDSVLVLDDDDLDARLKDLVVKAIAAWDTATMAYQSDPKAKALSESFKLEVGELVKNTKKRNLDAAKDLVHDVLDPIRRNFEQSIECDTVWSDVEAEASKRIALAMSKRKDTAIPPNMQEKLVRHILDGDIKALHTAKTSGFLNTLCRILRFILRLFRGSKR